MQWWRTARDLIERFDRPEPLFTLQYRPRPLGLSETARLLEEVVREGSLPEVEASWRLVEDGLTGTLFVTTSSSKHLEIGTLLEKLEGAAEGPRRTLRSFPIEHRRVEEVHELLGDLLNQGVLEPHRVPAEEGGPAGAAADPPHAAVQSSEGGGQVVISADETTGRILAYGEPFLLDEIGRLIEELDQRHPQILVQALIVSLTESQTLDLGAELQRLAQEGEVQFQLGSPFDLGSPDPTAGVLTPGNRAATIVNGFNGLRPRPRLGPSVYRRMATAVSGPPTAPVAGAWLDAVADDGRPKPAAKRPAPGPAPATSHLSLAGPT